MISSSLHRPVYRNRGDGHEAIANESAYDENGNILPKFLCNREGPINHEDRDRNDLNFLISHYIETMAVTFSGECSNYIRKLVSFKNFTNQSIYESIETFVNVFIKFTKSCLPQTNDFVTLMKLRESIEAVLIFMNRVRDVIEYGQVEKNSLSYKIYVVFGLLLDVELLASRYKMESFNMILDRLSKYMDSLLERMDNQSIAIFYSTEFLNSSATQNHGEICSAILEKMIWKNLPISSKILLFQLWERFSSHPRAENIVNDVLAQKIREEDETELRELSSIFTTIPRNCENIAELCTATKVNLKEAVQKYLQTQEELSRVNFTISEIESKDGSATEKKHSEERIATVPGSSVDSEHDYCSRFTSNSTERSSESSESMLTEEWPVEYSADEYSRTDERVEIELCDLCVELGTLAIDSCATETAPCPAIRSFSSADVFNEEDVNTSEAVYFTDAGYQLHCDTCEADEKCFSQQYDYIMVCRSNVDVESDLLPEMTFSEESRCQCLSCHNNLECLKKNLCMLTEYARERKKKIEELMANHAKSVSEFSDGSNRVPPEYKRSASETLEHKLPLKKRKFSLDKA